MDQPSTYAGAREVTLKDVRLTKLNQTRTTKQDNVHHS